MGKNKSRRFGDSIMKKNIYSTVFTLFFIGCQTQQEAVVLQSTLQNSISIVQDTTNSNFITQDYAQLHNQLREQYFQGHTLIRSSTLEQDAQNYANYLAQTGQFTHDPNNRSHKYGENLFAFSQNSIPDYADIIQKWYSEGSYYDYETNSCQSGKVCGHYTQIIWKNSQKIGCASAQYLQGRFKNGYITVCKYFPYGNIIGQQPY